MKINLPENVTTIIETLEKNGFEAYAVGGCVRDSILGKVPADWDITTSAKPKDVKRLFSHTIDTGIQHGTVTVLYAGEQPDTWDGYEVTTYRIDGEYSDGRHPNEVTFTSDLEEDLKRRDFTINAMAYSESKGLVDIFEGREDLQRGVIRCVGEPRERFTEDALRMLRAVRFAAQLDFVLDERTAEGIRALAPNLNHVSKERIQVELVKMITSSNPQWIREAYHVGLTPYFLPEFDVMMETPQNTIHHCMNVGDHTVEAMRHVSPTKVMRLAALLHDVAKPECRTTDEMGVDHFKGHPRKGAETARKILRRLKFDNETTKRVVQLVQWHDERPLLDEKHVRRAIVRIGEDAFPDIFELKRADTLAQSTYRRQDKMDQVAEFERLWNKIKEEEQCLSVSDLALSGKDLLAMGIPQGRELGNVLRALLDEVLEDPNRNTKEWLSKEVERYAVRLRES